jgi:hypothetical protein
MGKSSTYSQLHDQLHPVRRELRDFKFGTRIQFRLIATNVGGSYSERLWLHARTSLVAVENPLGWPGESN